MGIAVPGTIRFEIGGAKNNPGSLAAAGVG
jgi:hypothetical protein